MQFAGRIHNLWIGGPVRSKQLLTNECRGLFGSDLPAETRFPEVIHKVPFGISLVDQVGLQKCVVRRCLSQAQPGTVCEISFLFSVLRERRLRKKQNGL
jgi:hypothetical protein